MNPIGNTYYETNVDQTDWFSKNDIRMICIALPLFAFIGSLIYRACLNQKKTKKLDFKENWVASHTRDIHDELYDLTRLKEQEVKIEYITVFR